MHPVLTSSQHATKLLHAWRHQDLDEIVAELDSTVTFCRSGAAASAAEAERRELLEGILEEIGQLTPARGREFASELDTYVRLLEHLSRQ